MEIKFTPSDEFMNSIRQIIQDECRKTLHEFQDSQKNNRRYLTREEAAKILRTTTQSLYQWDRDGILVATRLGNKVLYRESQILDFQGNSLERTRVGRQLLQEKLK